MTSWKADLAADIKSPSAIVLDTDVASNKGSVLAFMCIVLSSLQRTLVLLLRSWSSAASELGVAPSGGDWSIAVSSAGVLAVVFSRASLYGGTVWTHTSEVLLALGSICRGWQWAVGRNNCGGILTGTESTDSPYGDIVRIVSSLATWRKWIWDGPTSTLPAVGEATSKTWKKYIIGY